MTEVPQLDALIRSVEAKMPNDSALDRVRLASQAAAELTHLGDSLIDHFVQEARHHGFSWAQIKRELRRTQEEANQDPETANLQQPAMSFFDNLQESDVFPNLNGSARQVLRTAREEAESLGHNILGTEHVLLGLVREREGIAHQVLESFGLCADKVRVRLREEVGASEGVAIRPGRLSPRALEVLEISWRESQDLGHSQTGTEHLLLGLITEGKGVGARVLTELGVDFEELRRSILALLPKHA
jgi:hypothetical protein